MVSPVQQVCTAQPACLYPLHLPGKFRYFHISQYRPSIASFSSSELTPTPGYWAKYLIQYSKKVPLGQYGFVYVFLYFGPLIKSCSKYNLRYPCWFLLIDAFWFFQLHWRVVSSYWRLKQVSSHYTGI
jgi:hypothetical protein